MKILHTLFVVSCIVLIFVNHLIAQQSDQINIMKIENSMAYAIEMHDEQLPFKIYYTPSNVHSENISVLNYRDLKLLHGKQNGLTKGGAIVLGGVAGFLVFWGIASISCGSNDYGTCQSLAPIVGLVVGVPIGGLIGAASTKNKRMYERRRRR